MRIAIIDLGTNSVRFDIHQLGPKKSARVLHREKVMVRLGQDVFVKGQLSADAIDRTIHAFLNFRKISDEFSVTRVIAIGTSALREAVDSPRLIAQIRKRTDIDVRVISGREEAKLIALGVLSNEKTSKGRKALIDIGGGSTEVSLANGKDVYFSESFPVGTARLLQVFLKQTPPKPEHVTEMRAYIRQSLLRKIPRKRAFKATFGIGSSGTARALIKIVRKTTGRKYLSAQELKELVRDMSEMTSEQLLAIPGMESKRIDMILGGAILLEETMSILGIKRLSCTDYSLRDGILREQLEINKRHLKSRIALHSSDLVEKARKLGRDSKNLRVVCQNATTLFRKMKKLHGLDENWRLYLEAAVVLRDTGEVISLVGHPEHSYYIVKNAKFPFVEDWESELVAQLCRYHEHHKVNFKVLPFENNVTLRKAFVKLLGILCVVDALDAVRDSPALLRRVVMRKKEVHVSFSRGSSSDLEMFRAESRKSIFEEAYGRKLLFRRTVNAR